MMRRLQLPTYGVFQKIVTMSSPVLATSSVSDDLTNRSKLSGYLGQKRRFASEKDICCLSSGNLISGEEKAGQNAFMRSLDERITVEIHCSVLVWRPFLGELHVPLAGRFEDYCGATLFGELFGDFFHASFDFLVLDSKLIEVIYALATLKMNQAKLEKFSRKDSKFRSVDQESSDLPSTQQHGTVSDHDTAFLSRSEKKMAHNKMVYKLIEKYSVLLVCSADNVGSNQLQAIRQRLRPDSVVFLGKNAMMKKSIQTYAEKSGNIVYQNMIPLLVGNVCLIFTKGDLIDVVVPPGNTVLELMKKGDKASSSESDLLSKLGIRPFSHGLVVKAMYGNGSVFDPAVLDLVEDELKENFSAGFSLWQPFLCLSTVLH